MKKLLLLTLVLSLSLSICACNKDDNKLDGELLDLDRTSMSEMKVEVTNVEEVTCSKCGSVSYNVTVRSTNEEVDYDSTITENDFCSNSECDNYYEDKLARMNLLEVIKNEIKNVLDAKFNK